MREKIKELQNIGFTIKGLSLLSGVAISSLYNISSGRLTNIPPETEKAINLTYEKLKGVFGNNA